MPSIDCKDEIVINAPISTVFDVVLDCPNWNRWVPVYNCCFLDKGDITGVMKIHHQYGYKPLILTDFVRSIDFVKKHDLLEESYIDGGLIGRGVWQFVEKENKTTASFHCTVKSKKIITHISFILMGKLAHRIVYKALLKKLKLHCE